MAPSSKATLRPLPLRIRPTRRFAQLAVGLAGYGASAGIMVVSGLGDQPWDVFHQGLGNHLGLSFGTVSVIVGAVVLLLWIPLRQRPGVGTVGNVFVVGVSGNLTLALLPAPTALVPRIVFMIIGVVLCAASSGLYIGARLGPGPRDGLMTGLAARGYSIRLVRTLIEVTVVILGAILGGTLGVGTIVYALTIGPLVQVFLPLFSVREPVVADISLAPAS
jgi:uncharacterized membrane protein YczE